MCYFSFHFSTRDRWLGKIFPSAFHSPKCPQQAEARSLVSHLGSDNLSTYMLLATSQGAHQQEVRLGSGARTETQALETWVTQETCPLHQK